MLTIYDYFIYFSYIEKEISALPSPGDNITPIIRYTYVCEMEPPTPHMKHIAWL